MNDDTFKKYVERLQEVNGVLEKLDVSIRTDAFALLRPYVTGVLESTQKVDPREAEPKNLSDASEDAEAFFNRFNHDKPSDNALLLAAHVYARFGTASFSMDDIRNLANEVGLTIPDRVDMTFASAQRDGKNLFRRAGRGEFRPTVYGEAHLKTTYGVNKGTSKKELHDS